MANYEESNIQQMDDVTLATAWELADKGRQYEGVEEDRRMMGREMAKRLKDEGDS